MSFIKKYFKMKFISIILIVASVAVVGLCLTMVVASDAIVEQHQQMSGNTINRRDSAKLVFIKNYITETGDISILKTLGKSITNALLPDASITGGGGKNKDDEDPPEPNKDIVYEPLSSPYGLLTQTQGSGHWSLIGSPGNTVESHGCYLFAASSVAYVHKGAGADGLKLEDAIIDYFDSNDISWSVTSDGKIQMLDSLLVGHGTALANHVDSFFGINEVEYSGDTTSRGWPTEEGCYIIWYQHSSGKHWIHVDVDSSGGYTKNSSGSGDDGHADVWNYFDCASVYKVS